MYKYGFRVNGVEIVNNGSQLSDSGNLVFDIVRENFPWISGQLQKIGETWEWKTGKKLFDNHMYSGFGDEIQDGINEHGDPQRSLKEGEYQCSDCQGVYNKGWSDEEAKKELKENFSPFEIAMGVQMVCDDCFQEFMGEKEVNE